MKKFNDPVVKVCLKILVGVSAGLILCGLFSLVLGIIFPEKNTEISLNTEIGMTREQRSADFEDMTAFIEDHVPFIYDYEELYGISFEEVKNYYGELVQNAESDYEYYCLLQGFINNIPSGHMGMGYPNLEYIPMLYQYTTSNYPRFGQACGYWEDVLHNECRKYYDTDYSVHAFYYLNGEYIESEYTNSINNIPYNGCRLLSVNGVPVDEFVKLCPLTYKLNYDHQYGKPFREIIVFNNVSGEECTVEYETESGETVSEKAYYGTSGVASSYIEYFRDIDFPPEGGGENAETREDASNIYTYYDEKRNVMYIKFDDFSAGGAETLKFIQENEMPDNIIIDLRENSGGMDEVCHAIIEELSPKSFEFAVPVYITPAENRYYGMEYSAKKSGELSFETKFKKLYEEVREEKFEGKAEKEYNICVLVSYVSVSAADKFAAIIKEQGLGTVIGAFNTKGEAYGSPDIKVLTESGLYFYYTPYKSLNSDGTDNSVYGTTPDVYVKVNDKFFKNRDKMLLNEEENKGLYENRVKCGDSILLKALEIIDTE